jgi:hypothetical protein
MRAINNQDICTKIQVKTFSAGMRIKLDNQINDWLRSSPESENATLIDLKFSVTVCDLSQATYSALLIYGYLK